MRVGYIGTGVMGSAMAQCLIEAGHEVTVYDVRREATAGLVAAGAAWAGSPREVAARSEVVFTSLPGPAQVEQVLLDPETGILAGLAKGGCFIDTTTNSPTVFRRLAAACLERGVEVLDSPVSSRPPEMTMMVGGAESTYTKYRPLLECMGKYIFYLGEAGAGCVAKLVTQYMGYCNFITAAEGLLIAAKAGIDLETLAQIVPVSAGGSRQFAAFPTSVFNGTLTAPGTLDIVAKDLMLACEMARDMHVLARMGSVAEDIFKRGQAAGWGNLGYPNVVRVLEEWAGIELRTRQ
jgi:3-hydroxyisobutyrate dehydrogenase-like beta-hydroxyacid dehydrogenase